ncbi:MoaD/ThiS family protein [Cytophagaceae bacterium ABcell3]|nr:MoaD/ThiS family protein [Cytophagaceae bacterium ABcell3]
MSIKILFFGSVTDITGQKELTAENISDTNTLKNYLLNKFPKINGLNFVIARNQEAITDNVPLNDGDEVALLPPFSGG